MIEPLVHHAAQPVSGIAVQQESKNLVQSHQFWSRES